MNNIHLTSRQTFRPARKPSKARSEKLRAESTPAPSSLTSGPVDSVVEIRNSGATKPTISTGMARKTAAKAASELASTSAPGSWMSYPADEQYKPGESLVREESSPQVSTFQQVIRNERARVGLLELLDSDKWKGQLEGSKLAGLRPELEKPGSDVKSTLTRALGELEGGYTQAHTQRAIGTIGLPLAKELGLSAKEQSALKEASGLYDIGKLAVDEKILNHDGKWPEEKAGEWFAKVSNHVHPEIVTPLLEAFELSAQAKDGILHHHERPNGWAYCKESDAPAWDRVSSVARVIGMADTVDAMQWRKANINRPVERKLDLPTIQKFLKGDAEKGKVDSDLVDLVFSRVLNS